MSNRACELYLEERILSADPLELVRLLYDGAIGAVREARQALAAGDIRARSQAISKASAIVLELNAALHHSRGWALSQRLAALYDYIFKRLLDANIQQIDAPLAEVLGLLSTLAEAWRQIANQPEMPEAGSPWAAPSEPPDSGAPQAWSL